MKEPNNKHIGKLSNEEIMRLVKFFELLLQADMRAHPEKYKSTSGSIKRTDALPTHQAAQKD